jgi:hypothetical protein
MNEHSHVTEEDRPDDPRKRLAFDPASEHRGEVLGSGGGAEQLVGLLFGCDAARLAKSANELGPGQSIGSSQISGITRFVRDWFRAKPAFVFSLSAATAAYSSPTSGVAVAWKVLPGISTVTSGFATRL